MRLTDRFVLPTDVELVQALELPAEMRATFEHEPDDWTVSRRMSRTASRVVNHDLASLLELFRGGATIPQAVAAFCRGTDRVPDEVLEAVLPSLQNFISVSWLVPADSPAAEPIAQSHAIGSEIASYRIVDCVRVLEDTQLYQAERVDGARVALKLMRHPADPQAEAQLHAETSALEAIGGPPAPRLYDHGVHGDHVYLALEWCAGVSVSVRAEELRREGARCGLHALCVAIVDAYEELHRCGVVHADVHPGNILVDDTGSVRIVDFGLSVGPSSGSIQPRGGVAAFFAPEYAADRLAGRRPARADQGSEQYAVAALLYALLAGEHYLRLSTGRDALLRQIIENPPIPFSDVGTVLIPQLETALMQALSKAPHERFASTSEFAIAIRSASPPRPAVVPQVSGEGGALRDYVDAHLDRLGLGVPHSKHRSEQGPHATITFGSAGVAYALYRIAVRRGDAQILAQADQWVAKAVAEIDTEGAIYDETLEIDEASVGRISPYHAASGVHAVRAIVAQALGDFASVRDGVEGYLATIDGPADRVDLTLGRSSVLIGNTLLLDTLTGLEHAAPMTDLEQRLRTLGDRTLTEIWAELSDHGPIGPGNPVTYLGVAHGWAGVCLATLVWCEASGIDTPPELQGRLGELADHAEPVGDGLRWPIQTHARGHHHNYMNSWCNGAPGYVFLWNAAHRRFGEEPYSALAHRAAVETWQRRDGHGSICCGSAGRAYALLNQHRNSGNPVWLERAQVMCELERRVSFPMMRDSLYKGELGGVVLTADLEDPQGARLPFFEREV